MNVEVIREYCSNKKGVTGSFSSDDVSLIMETLDEIFALIDLEGTNSISLRCDSEHAIELREHYAGIERTYHFNKKYQNGVYSDRDVDNKLIKELVDHSCKEVIRKFTKKLRTEYGALP